MIDHAHDHDIFGKSHKKIISLNPKWPWFLRSKHMTSVLHGQQGPWCIYVSTDIPNDGLVNLVSGVVPLDCRSRSLWRYQSLASRTRDPRALHQKIPKTSRHINMSLGAPGFLLGAMGVTLLSLFVIDRNLYPSSLSGYFGASFWVEKMIATHQIFIPNLDSLSGFH